MLVCSELSSIVLQMLRRKHPTIEQDFVFVDQVRFAASLGCDSRKALISRNFDNKADDCALVSYKACTQSASTFLSVPIDSESIFPMLWKLIRLSLDLPADILR